MTNKVLITGISGFVGEHLSVLLSNNGFEVFGFDRHANKNNRFQVDITNKNAVFEIIQSIKPDFIVHLAAQSSVRKSWENKDNTFLVNVTGTKNLLDGIISAEIEKTCKLLVVSSAEIYGLSENTSFIETSRLVPVSPYGDSRLEQERLLQEYLKRGLNIVIARSFPHTGPGQRETFVCSSFAKQIAMIEITDSEHIIHTGNLNIRRDFLDVRDVVKAYYKILQNFKSGEIYNICSGNTYSIDFLLNKLISFSEENIEIKQEKSRFRNNDIPVLSGDNSKIENELSWKPEISIEKTLKDILDYWRKNIIVHYISKG